MRNCLLASILGACVLAGAAPTYTLKVTSPNGGETWALGSQQPITWAFSGSSGTVKIVLIRNRVHLGIIQEGVPATAGSIRWTVGQYVGGTAPAGAGYSIRIRHSGGEPLDDSNGPFTLTSAQAPPQPQPPGSTPVLKLTAPNGGESWLAGSDCEIRWDAANVHDNIDLILWKNGAELGPIAESLPASDRSFKWKAGSYKGGVAFGMGFEIWIITARGEFKDKSDAMFAIPGVMPRTDRPGEVYHIPPYLESFLIDGGAPVTDNRVVTLNNTARMEPTYIRVKAEGVWGPWQAYNHAPVKELPDRCGEHELSIQVKNAYGESEVRTDRIRYAARTVRTLTAMAARDLCTSANAANPSAKWTFKITKTDCDRCAQLFCITDNGGMILQCWEEVKGLLPQGHKCEFEVFGGRPLKDEWEFISYKYRGPVGKDWGYAILQEPQSGDHYITLGVRVWHGISNFLGGAAFEVETITLKGPCDQDVSQAFR
jgi:hypothetical protein